MIIFDFINMAMNMLILQGFGSSSVKRFVMSVPKKIDDPSVLKIWHDNSGSGNEASWYLNKITLQDIQTQEKYVLTTVIPL